MAPEQALGQQVDRRADLFAVGIMLWEVLSGKRMWRGLQEVGIMHALAVGEIPKLQTVMPEASELACRIVDRALAKRPQDRYATAEEFRRELEAYAKLGEHQPTSREVGQMLFETFGEERKQIQAVIEERMRSVKQSQSGSGHPSVAPLPTVIPRDVPSFSSPLNVAGASGPSMFRSVVTVPPPEPPERARNMRVASIALALTALAATALAVTIFVARGQSAHPGAAPTTTSSSPPVASSAVAPHTATVRVEAAPAKARVFLDDLPLTGNPTERKVQADGSIHHIRVEAAGFDPQTQEVVVDGDRTIKITLSALPGTPHTGGGTPTGPITTGTAHVKPPASGDPDLGF
jgi:serine/threonine-protein kinase